MKAAHYINIRIIIVLSVMTLSSFVAGCVKHIDYISSLHISGRVLEVNSNTPLDNVEIYFIDTGLDSVASKGETKGTKIIGFSDKEGYFDLAFKYWWGHEEGFLIKEPKYTFNLVFMKKGYVEKPISYNYMQLPYENGETQVDIGPITLEPE